MAPEPLNLYRLRRLPWAAVTVRRGHQKLIKRFQAPLAHGLRDPNLSGRCTSCTQSRLTNAARLKHRLVTGLMPDAAPVSEAGNLRLRTPVPRSGKVSAQRCHIRLLKVSHPPPRPFDCRSCCSRTPQSPLQCSHNA